MSVHRIVRFATALVFVSTALLTACDSDPVSPGDQEQILAVWGVTSFLSGDTDFIEEGMTLIVTLDEDGTYTFEVTNDQADVCGGAVGANCTTTGSFEYTATTVTIDDDDPQDATTFDYDIQGATMTWIGDIGGGDVVITFNEVS